MTNDAPPASATLLLVRDDPFEVLMVRRSSRGTFASTLVFPGGAIEPDDSSEAWEPLVDDFAAFAPEERSRRIGAIRETWEETSILIATTSPIIGEPEPAHAGPFRDLVERAGLRLRLDALTSFAHWITPLTEPRRFDTRFFVAVAPKDQVAVADGFEIVGTEWVRPADAAAAARRGEWPIIFPTLMNLDRLAEGGSVRAVLDAALVRPAFTVQPIVETDADGARVIVIPKGAGYAVTRFSPPAQP
jgi:8-oxo-dGTP pyrophosphatase MutT (NUDIX family)